MEPTSKLDLIYKKYCESENSHVYLVQSNSVEKAVEDIKELIIKINKHNNIDIENFVRNETLPTLLVVEPDKQEIKAEATDRLLTFLQKIPVITNENYFIVKYAEKLNEKSGNQLLKVIEEPECEMLGFFICTNADNVMKTIQSRSQFISISYNEEIEFEDNLITDATGYLNNIHSNKSLIENKKVVDKYKDLDALLEFINCLINEEKKYINSLNNFDIIKHESLILKLIYELETQLRMNANANLVLDKFMIEVSRL